MVSNNDNNYQFRMVFLICDFDIEQVLEILRNLKDGNMGEDTIPDTFQIKKVDDKSICLKVSIGVNIHKQEQIQSIDTFTSNDTGIPSIEREMVTV